MPQRYYLPLLLLVQLPAYAQNLASVSDTARTVRLPEATVTGYGTRLPLRRTAAAIGVVDAATIERFNQTSLTQAVNTLPGVRLEERATASYRISVRGSTLRSPFGVRNVKVYYNDIPFTEAAGTTQLNLLDPAIIGRIEVIKGPAGSVYGAGTGGVILFENRKPRPDEARAQVGFTVGSFGLRRYSVVAESGTATGYLRAQYARQSVDGYRDQSALRRDVFALDGEFTPSDKRTIAVHGLYTDIYYQLPGGLTRAQYEQNPRQARPGTATAPGTVAQKASYASRTALLGVSHEYRFSDRFSNKTTLYTSATSIQTPYLVDFERNTGVGWGGRSSFNYRTTLAGRTLRLGAGAELQNSFEDARSYRNLAGVPGTLRYDDEIRTAAGFVFGQAELELPAGLLATVAASYNRQRYRIARISDAATQPDSYQFERNFRPQVSPRVALLKELTPRISAYASVSSGFSPPTDEEIRPSDGSLNRALQAERGTSYELGTKGNAFNNRLTFDLALFDFRLRQTIVTRTTDAGTSVFFNSGNTRQRGVEAAVSGWLWRPTSEATTLGSTQLAGLRAWGSFAYNHFRFGAYQNNDQDNSGKRLTGTAPQTLTAGLDAGLRIGFYLSPTINHQARIPLNDANTAYAAGYWTFGTRAGWHRTVLGHLETDIYAGIENALDRRYSLGNDLNAFGSRYFQPAPGRNYYAGATLGWKI
ncbi:TonB-dependent receptor family protein [Hymenobacter crusticola]|uniref:TonB-dependent receptor n=1 Tax=Hymenobacter crusticola TaxID=1770526 RepID=A0A243W8D3_9BACT|nr:TonB-dependent receptor [Hymenobacter crusticola]OUJ71193.1 hypothetical protein BXP70_22175 [Hymenobacter crusticola]